MIRLGLKPLAKIDPVLKKFESNYFQNMGV